MSGIDGLAAIWRIVALGIGVVGAAVIAFHVLSTEETEMVETAERPVPPMDRKVPEETETATFALG